MSYINLIFGTKTCEEHVGRPARTCVADCEAILREQYSWEVKR